MKVGRGSGRLAIDQAVARGFAAHHARRPDFAGHDTLSACVATCPGAVAPHFDLPRTQRPCRMWLSFWPQGGRPPASRSVPRRGSSPRTNVSWLAESGASDRDSPTPIRPAAGLAPPPRTLAPQVAGPGLLYIWGSSPNDGESPDSRRRQSHTVIAVHNHRHPYGESAGAAGEWPPIGVGVFCRLAAPDGDHGSRLPRRPQ